MQNNKNTKHIKLVCFSPQVMIATFVLEITLAVYVGLRFVINKPLRVVLAILILLATFQLSEYGICEQFGLTGTTWAQAGFSAITLLPPLGLHLVYMIANKRLGLRSIAIYAPAFIWITLFVLGGIMKGQGCSGNYVIFQIKKPYDLLYYAWYDLLLLFAVARAWLNIRLTKSKQFITANWSLIVGYLSFIVPSILIRLLFTFNDKTASALPSIMCGFAVVFALVLATKTTPAVTTATLGSNKSKSR